PIGKYQFVQDMIAEMVLGYETSKLLVMQAAWMKNEGKRNTRETSLAKWHATESAFRAAHLAIQVHGAYGYSAEYGIERYFRNARAPIIYEGTTQIHKLLQAEHALGYRRLNGRDGQASPLCSWPPPLAPVHRERPVAPGAGSAGRADGSVDVRLGLGPHQPHDQGDRRKHRQAADRPEDLVAVRLAQVRPSEVDCKTGKGSAQQEP